MLKLLLLLPSMGMSLFWSGAMQSSEIQPLRIVGVSEPVAPIERARPVDQAASGEKDLNVEVSRSALLLPAVPPVDHERIEAIREAIDAGTYRLRPDQIANALIAAFHTSGSDQ